MAHVTAAATIQPMPSPRAMAGELWQMALAKLSTRLNAHVFQSFFRPVRPLLLEDGQLSLGVPSAFHMDWLRDHYQAVIEEELGKERPGCRIRFEVVEGMDVEADAEARPVASTPAATSNVTQLPVPSTRERIPSRLSKRYGFADYVLGPSNQFAAAACQAVADNPGRAYNPLFLFGGVGLGKTHLLHAIGNKIAQTRPEWNVLYLSGEDFTNELIQCLQSQRMEQFRAKYRAHCDVLLLDDIHFIAGKERTQEEFFHSFNHLYAAAKQVVVTSDRFPHEMTGLEERLRTRLQWGLIADIQPPELETRVAILNSKAAQSGVTVPEDVAVFLATHIRNNVRELEGSLVRLVAASSFKKRPLDMDLCREELRDQVIRAARVPTCEEILKHVGTYFNVNVAELRGNKRHRHITLCRHTAMYLCRKYTNASFPEIGNAFGGKDHTTVMASVRRIEDLMKRDPDTAKAVEQLGKILET